MLRRRRSRDESGAFAAFAAIVITAFMLVLVSLVVDLGLARDTKAQAQNAADAAALAAAGKLYLNNYSSTPNYTTAVAAAKQYAATNFGTTAADWASCTDPAPLAHVPDTTARCISFGPSATKPEYARVVVPYREVDAKFNPGARLFVDASARARVVPRKTQPCGLCILGSGITHDFQNGDVLVNNADIRINGSSRVGSQGLVSSTGAIYVEGAALGSADRYEPDAITGVAAVPDPLGGLVVPPSMTGLVNHSNPCTEGPGIYAGYNFNNVNCLLTPGLYVVRGGTWSLGGSSSTILRGSGVTIYLTCASGTSVRQCNSGEAGATIDASGNGNIDLQAPTSGPLQGVTIMMDRNNTSTLRLTGNGTAGLTGAVYAASGRLQMNGNGCTNGLDGMVVVKDIEFNGNPSCLQLDYQVSQNPVPSLGDFSLDQ